MAQFRISSVLVLALTTLLVGFADLGSGRPVVAMRDVVDHELFARDLDLLYHELTTRDNIEKVFFNRDSDVDVGAITTAATTATFKLDSYLRSGDSEQPNTLAYFFKKVGDVVKKCVRRYWHYMIIQAHALIGQDGGRWERAMDALPREYRNEGDASDSVSAHELHPAQSDEYEHEEGEDHRHAVLSLASPPPHILLHPRADPIPLEDDHPPGSSWFSRSLIHYRDAMLDFYDKQEHS